MAERETTEWEDILQAKGITPSITTEQIEEMVDSVIEQHMNGKNIEDRDLKELEELEDEDLEDDRVVEHYKRLRMQELQAQSSLEIYGRILELSKSEYQTKVNEASKKCVVIVLLYQSYLIHCNQLQQILERLAAKYKAVSFLKIQADLCIENYPDRNVPSVLIYKGGEMLDQIVGLSRFGGNVGLSGENVEMVLKGVGALAGSGNAFAPKKDEEDDEDEGDDDRFSKSKYQSKMNRMNARSNEDDDDWE